MAVENARGALHVGFPCQVRNQKLAQCSAFPPRDQTRRRQPSARLGVQGVLVDRRLRPGKTPWAGRTLTCQRETWDGGDFAWQTGTRERPIKAAVPLTDGLHPLF